MATRMASGGRIPTYKMYLIPANLQNHNEKFQICCTSPHQKKHQMYFTHQPKGLPAEVILQVVRHLDVLDILRLEQVSAQI